MKFKLDHFATAAVLMLAASAAQAATVSLTNIRGTWFEPTPLANISSNTGGGTANTSIRWDASGYDFNAVLSAAVSVPPSPSANFALGSFSHINQPIFTSITGVKLKVTANINVDATVVGSRDFFFQFIHEETPNGGQSCPYGGLNNQGVNINGCADRVSVQFIDSSESFTIGADTYTLNVFGFQSGIGPITSDFLTAERQTNTANLIANVTLRSSLTVPEPGTLALAGLSLVGLAAMRRRAS